MIIPLGGGGSKVVASIVVTYPVGSTLTCTLGSKVLTAKDTSGKWVFGLPSIGSWVVKATNGTDTATQTVSITTSGQGKAISLAYKYYIFRTGTGLASGLTINKTNGNTPTVNTTSISWTGSVSGGGFCFYTSPGIPLADYTSLKIDFECSYNYGGEYSIAFGFGTDATTGSIIGNTNWTAKVANQTNGTIARNTLSCDVSDLTTSQYFKMAGLYTAGTIYNIWLE